MKNITASVLVLLLSLLTACSGGSSGSSDKNTDKPGQPQNVSLSFEAIKLFQFKWEDVEGASHYQLQENPDGVSGFTPVGELIPQGTETIPFKVKKYTE